jgi:anti-sigma-K factor RskA
MSALPPTAPEDGFDGEDLTAAEYALGVLDREARAAVEARAEQDAAFAADILGWTVRLAPLIEEISPVEPSATLWPRIETAIDRPKVRTGPVAATETPPRAPANDAEPRGFLLWRIWAVGASVAAVAAIAVIVAHPQLPSGSAAPGQALFAQGGGASRTLVANLALTESKAAAFTVAYDPVQSTIYAGPDSGFSIPVGRSAELWLIPADGKPRPMGLVDPTKPATMPMPPEFKSLAKEQATLALSIEPVGGSKTGLPTGPVVAAGKFISV